MTLLLFLRRAERAFIVGLFLTMVVLFFGNVIAREIGGQLASRLAWVEEAVRFMNVFLVFMTLGLALERGRHVCIETLRDRLPRRARYGLFKLIDATGFFFSIYLAWLGIGLVQFVLGTGQRSPTLDLPVGWIYMAPVLGFGLLALRFALSFVGLIERHNAVQRSGEVVQP